MRQTLFWILDFFLSLWKTKRLLRACLGWRQQLVCWRCQKWPMNFPGKNKSFVTDWCWQRRQMRREQQAPRAPTLEEGPSDYINPYLWAFDEQSSLTDYLLHPGKSYYRLQRDTWEHSTGKPICLSTYQRQDIEFFLLLLLSSFYDFSHSLQLIFLSVVLLSDPLSVSVSILPHLSLLFSLRLVVKFTCPIF